MSFSTYFLFKDVVHRLFECDDLTLTVAHGMVLGVLFDRHRLDVTQFIHRARVSCLVKLPRHRTIKNLQCILENGWIKVLAVCPDPNVFFGHECAEILQSTVQRTFAAPCFVAHRGFLCHPPLNRAYADRKTRREIVVEARINSSIEDLPWLAFRKGEFDTGDAEDSRVLGRRRRLEVKHVVHSHFLIGFLCPLPKTSFTVHIQKPLLHKKEKNMSEQDIVDALEATEGDIEKAADLVSAKRTVSLTDFEDRDRDLKKGKVVSFSAQNITEIEIPKDCQREKWTKGVFLAEGDNATVFKVKRKNQPADDKTYALKINPFQEGEMDVFEREVFFSLKAAKLEVGPKIYDYRLCLEKDGPDFYYIVQELLGDPLEPENEPDPKDFPAQLFVDILEKVYTLETNGISHNDLHAGNVVKNLAKERIYIIDYGLAEETEKEKKDPGLYIKALSALALDLGHGSPPRQIPFGIKENDFRMPRKEKKFYRKIETDFFKKHWPELYLKPD